jgi:hypothetical protein
MSEPHEQRAREIVRAIQYVTVATVTADGRPWNSPVYSAFDADGRFYWTSTADSQHSANIRANGRAFLTIYDSTAPEGTGVGVYIEADVDELAEPEHIALGRRCLRQRTGKLPDGPDAYLPGAARRVYRATPRSVWLSDAEQAAGRIVRDFRIPIDPSALRGLSAT